MARDGRRAPTLALALAVAAVSTVAGTGAAGAQVTVNYGPMNAERGGGGVGAPPGPKLVDVRCIEKCAGLHKATKGSTVQATGSRLKDVEKVVFNGKGGHRVKVKPNSVGRHSLKASIPKNAVSGKPRVIDAFGNHDASSQRLKIISHLPPSGTFKLREAKANPGKAYFDGKTKPHLDYVFSADGRVDVRVNIVRQHADGRVEKSFIRHDVKPNTENRIVWSGRGDDGKQSPGGPYRFTVGPATGGGSLDTTGAARFGFFGYEFPVRGHHSYGDGIGAGRGHQGQDVLANCGTPLVAARGGKVQWRESNPGEAGGYGLVIDGTGTGRDFVYYHLLHLPKFHKGDRVRTGQRLGSVGQTGDATACHLHFEIWSPPGWYEGGTFTNPTDDLKHWDKWS
jgi:murein DD-endopeptidase MepM/ murein hydrolase activator NlpD